MNPLQRLWKRLKDSAAESRAINFDDPYQDFTPRARSAFALAAKHSERLRHNFIGTEHLLLGLIELGQGVAFNVLKRLGVNLESAARDVEQFVGVGPDQPRSIPPPLTPRVRRVIALAHEEQKALQHTYLGTEHLLLGLLKEGNGVGARVLKQRQIDLDKTRQEILRELDPNFGSGTGQVTTSIFVEKANPELQDRICVSNSGMRTIIAVADGAGGISGGAQAAELFVQSISAHAAELKTADDCGRLLQKIDQELSNASDCGETTGIVVVIGPDRLIGAGVGDSAAWLFSGDSKTLLTNGPRKPFLGTGSAWPAAFSSQAADGTLVVATDGLWKYAGLESIAQKVRTAALRRGAQVEAELGGIFQGILGKGSELPQVA